MEESEDVTGTRKISSLSLLPNLNSDRHNKNYYDTNQYSQNDGRKINSIELSRQSSMTRHSSSSNNRICCSNVYCSPEWRRISRKSIIISVFLFFGGLVSITDHLTLVYLLSFSLGKNVYDQAIFLSGLVIYFRSMQSKGSEFLILGSISK